MSGQLEQGGMETDGVAVALHNNAFEIVVEDDPRDPGPCPKGLDMAAQEVLHAGIEEEAQEDVARITQHHDEGHQGTLCTACKMANVPSCVAWPPRHAPSSCTQCVLPG
jgi:hypothetical protein